MSARRAQTQRFLDAVLVLQATIKACETFAEYHASRSPKHAVEWHREAEIQTSVLCDMFEYSMDELDRIDTLAVAS